MTIRPYGCLGLMIAAVAGGFAQAAPSDSEDAPPPYRLVRPEGGIPEGFAWWKEAGIDFVVYRAGNESEPSTGVGIYVGLHPSFHGPDETCSKTGVVAGRPVVWCERSAGDDASSPAIVQTLLEHTPCAECLPLQLHIWVGAPAPARLEDLLRRLETLELVPER